MNFEHSKFETGVARVLSALESLKKALNFDKAGKGLNEIDAASKKVDLSHIGKAVDDIRNKFGYLSVAALAVFATIATRAVSTAATMAKAFTIDPVIQGFREYETQINAVQTILSNTAAAGTNIKQVNAALDELNSYADKTIYNFSEMARNIGTFTAAGVDLKASTAAIKGIANLAAVSGSNAQQASTAMYQLSQALAAGKVTLMDWNSVVNAGMGGTVFQRALANTAVKMGTLKKSTVALKGPMKNVSISGLSFRESISDPKVGGWLTSGVLTKTLAQFTGDMTDAQLAAEGFSKAEIKAIQAQAKTAMAAASQVKTISQAFDVAKETAGSGWTKTWSIIFGDFDTAKKDMTSFSNFMNDIINKNADARNAMLSEWAKFGGRTAGIDALKYALQDIMQIINPIKQAWKEVFPATTGKQLAETTMAIRDFLKSLILAPDVVNKIKYVFKGLFTVLSIGKSIISGVIGFVKDMFGIFTAGSGEASSGILDFAWNISNLIQRFDYFLKSTNAIPAFFDRLYNAVGPNVAKIREFVNTVKDAIGGALGQLPGLLNQVRDAATGADQQGLTPMQKTAASLKSGWDALTTGLRGALDFFKNFSAAIKDAFAGGGGIGNAVQENLSKINWPLIFKATIGAGFVSGVGLMIKAIYDAIQLFLVTPKKVMQSITNVFNNLGGVLQSYQNNLKSKTLLTIAAAIVALAIALKILSTIDVPSLVLSIGAMKLLFMMLNQTIDSIGKLGDNKGMLKIPAIAASLLLIGGAMLLFALAIKVFALMDIGTLIKGMSTMGVIIAGIVGTAKLLEKAQGDILRFSASMLLIAFAMNALLVPTLAFGNMDPSTILQGGIAMVALVGALGGAMNAMPKSGQMVKSAAALLLIALALNMMVIPIAILGNMDLSTLVKGIGAIAAIMLILVVALNAMEGALPGAAAMIVASAALLIFSTAMQNLAKVGFGSVILGILGIVIAMAAIAGAAFLLAPAAIPMAIFGAALVVLGAGFALLGGGALAFAAAMAIVVTMMSLGIPILTDAINNAIEIIPLLAKAFYTGLVEFSNAFALASPTIMNAIASFILSMLATVNKLTPAFMNTLRIFLTAGVDLIVAMVPVLALAGVRIVMGLLEGMARYLPRIIAAGTNLIVQLIVGIGTGALRIAKAAGDTLIKFLNGLTDWINTNSARLGKAGGDLAWAIVKGIAVGITSGIGTVLSSLRDLAGNAIQAAKDFFHINSPSKDFIAIGGSLAEGTGVGVDRNAHLVDKPIENMATRAIGVMKDSLSGLSDALTMEMDLNPTIAPVLDLETFRKDAAGINGILAPSAISASTSTGSANTISATTDANAQALQDQALANGGTLVEFKQYNTSPKALSSAEIYRQTRNQLSVVKEALAN